MYKNIEDDKSLKRKIKVNYVLCYNKDENQLKGIDRFNNNIKRLTWPLQFILYSNKLHSFTTVQGVQASSFKLYSYLLNVFLTNF